MGTEGKLTVRARLCQDTCDVLEFRTCCGLKLDDQNLQVIAENGGPAPVELVSRLEFECRDGKTVTVENLYPQPSQVVPPGQGALFTSWIDEAAWSKCLRGTMRDKEGKAYPVELEK
ncbi:MAG: hypothetical protein D6806_08870 [Deltaproteobacteria bacterium]|nr:MAG: hypothetical protein D6806_08870 [Deltaproteobacteria bacterium]